MTHAEERAARLEQAIRVKRAAARSRSRQLAPRPRDGEPRLGDLQRSVWLAHRMDPTSPAYNLTSAFLVRGRLDAAALERAFNAVVARHRILRSTFRVERDEVLQQVHPPTPLTVEVLTAGEGEALAAAVAEASRPFDLAAGPLIRLRLVEEAAGNRRVLLLVLHHLLADERSLALFWQEIGAAYAGRLDDPEPPVQYDDYLHWLEQREPRHRQAQLDYWRRRLDPLPDELRLPFERPARLGEAARGRLLSRALRQETRRGVRRLAADAGATPFTAFAFAFRLLLQRYAPGQRMAFATPVSARSHPAAAGMIGYFLNPVVVPTPVGEERRVEPALRGFARELRADLAHAALPFQELTEELAPPRRHDRHPVFQAMFVYQDTGPAPRLGEARLEPVTLDLGASKFDLTLFVTERARSLEIAVEHRADRFDEIWMRGLLGHYAALLEHLPADRERRVAEVPMLAVEERERLRGFARGREPRGAATDLLPRQILDRVRQAPRSAAVVCGGVRWSYGKLADAARSSARELAGRGANAGDRVGLFVDRSASMIAGILGCHARGAAYVPLDPEYPAARNRDLLEDADVVAVLTTSALRGRLPAGRWPAIEIDRLAEPGEAGPQAGSPAGLEPECPAYVLYTSGSTGRPKGVVVTHGNLRASTAARLEAYDDPPRRFLLVPSVAFDSSVAGIFWTLATGGCLVIPTEDEVRDPRRLVRLAARERVTGLLCVPSLWARLLEAGGERLQGLESAIVAGESCPPRLVAEHFRVLPRTRLFNEYGPTEATVWATLHEVTADDAPGPVPIGRPIPGVRVELLDALGRPVPAGIPGEAWISGPTVAQGYWRRPTESETRFVGESASEGRRYRTGDRMAWTADGRLLFLGREDEQIKLRGFRIEPGEIEASLLELPGIERAAVATRAPGAAAAADADPAAAQLVAFVQTRDAGRPAGWRRHLATRLPAHMIPSRLVALPELPRLPNGKVDRRRLRDLPLDAEAPVTETAALLDTREQALLSLWQGLLGRSEIGPHDNFFELGGHSLLVVEMALAIERDFEVTLSPAEVFENPTVHELARRIEQRSGPRATPYQHLFPIQPRGRGTPFVVALPHFFTEMFATRFRGERPVYGLRGVSLRPEGNLGRWPTMTDLGVEMVAEIRRRFPDESVLLAGYSFGATMAVEAARRMEEQGLPARRLYLIAPMPLDLYRFGPFAVQLDGLRRPVTGLSAARALRLWARANHPLTRRPYRRAWRRLAIEPWRRLLALVGRIRKRAGLPLTPRILHADVRVERFRLHARYQPGVLETPTVIFNAQETETDAAATWRPHFRGPFTVHPTPDPHREAPSVEAARRVILRHLSDLGEA